MSVRVRLTLLFAAGTAVVALVGGALFVNALSSRLRGTLESGLQARADSIAQQVPGGDTALNVPDPGSPRPASTLTDRSSFALVLANSGRILGSSGAGTASTAVARQLLPQAQHRTVVSERRVGSQRDSFLVLARRTEDSKDVVVVGTSLQTVNSAVNRVEAEALVGGALSVVMAAIAAWLLAGAALRPVERMRRQAAEISEHDETAHLDIPGSRDEIAALAHTFNDLLRRLQGALSRQRGFVASAGHELRTPLAVLKGELELASKPGRSKEELSAAVAEAAAGTDHLVRLAEDLLLLAQAGEPVALVHSQQQDLVPLVDEVISLFAGVAKVRGVALVVDHSGPLCAPVDATRFRQVMSNLMENALRYAPPGSNIVVRLGRNGGTVSLDVLDRGPGFPPEFLPRAFDRFSRADMARSRDAGGTGLGLAIVQSLVEAHGGHVQVANQAGSGAIVSIELPADLPA